MWASLKRTFRQLGTADALLYCASQALVRVSGRRARIVKYHIVAQPVAATPVVRGASGSSTARRLMPGDAALAALPRAAAVIDRRFARGDICLAIFSKETLAGFLWLAFGVYEEDDVRCTYRLEGAQLAWDYDVHVEPAYRMGRTLGRLWDFANATLSSRDVRWSLSRISAFNPESLAAHARLGARRTQSITFVCLGPLQAAFPPGKLLPTMSFEGGIPPELQVAAPGAFGRQ